MGCQRGTFWLLPRDVANWGALITVRTGASGLRVLCADEDETIEIAESDLAPSTPFGD
jgi:hypothetical protein